MNLTSKNAKLGLRIFTKSENGYFHVYAVPVVIGNVPGEPTRRASDYVDSISNYDTIGGLQVSGLSVKSQGNNDDAPRRLYGHEVVFRNLYEADLREAVSMAKTLTTINRKMEKFSDKFGRPTTFGAFVARVAQALGVTEIVFERKDREDAPNPLYRYQILGILDGIYKIDRMVDEWVAAGAPKAEVAS